MHFDIPFIYFQLHKNDNMKFIPCPQDYEIKEYLKKTSGKKRNTPKFKVAKAYKNYYSK